MTDDKENINEEKAVSDQVVTAKLDELTSEGGKESISSENPDLEVVLDIPVTISMEVGATQITIRNLLQLNQG